MSATSRRSWRRSRGAVEYNIEGDPRPGLLALVHEVAPHQCTLVPVRPGEITSQAGWPADTPRAELAAVIADLSAAGVRVSLFVDPDREAITMARDVGAHRVELYTEPFARAFARGPGPAAESFASYAAAARVAHECGLGVNAGHDLDLANLVQFRTLPHLAEVSIGHALMSRALFVGLHDGRARIPRRRGDAAVTARGRRRRAGGAAGHGGSGAGGGPRRAVARVGRGGDCGDGLRRAGAARPRPWSSCTC